MSTPLDQSNFNFPVRLDRNVLFIEAAKLPDLLRVCRLRLAAEATDLADLLRHVGAGWAAELDAAGNVVGLARRRVEWTDRVEGLLQEIAGFVHPACFVAFRNDAGETWVCRFKDGAVVEQWERSEPEGSGGSDDFDDFVSEDEVVLAKPVRVVRRRGGPTRISLPRNRKSQGTS